MTTKALKANNPKKTGLPAKPPKELKAPKTPAEKVAITAPNFQQASLRIRGTVPYVQHAFSQKALQTMMETQMSGSTSRKGKLRQPKNFQEVYKNATHFSDDGWIGIPAAAIRNAMISACRVVGFKMTLAKLSLFVVPNGFDKLSRDPLIKITKGKPYEHFGAARNSNGSTDVRCRPMWDPGWEAIVTIKWDADQFSATDIVNLLSRVGAQVGLGEGRADSRNSAGMGWGHFEVVT
jgi:hypothetical protein